MKIAVVGCGAVGSYYGARLCRLGEEVHFLLRTDYEAVKANGVRVQSCRGDFHVRPQAARHPEEIGVCDLVLIGLKTTANDQFPRLLPPLVGAHTAVMTLQNGLGNEEDLARLFPVAQILGGLCFVCLNRLEPGVIRHIDHGRIVMGEFQRAPEPRTHRIAARLRQADVPCEVTENLARTHWEKLVWNIPFNGLGVAGVAGLSAMHSGDMASASEPGRCLPTDQLLANPRWADLVRRLMREVIQAARALGFQLEAALADSQIERTRTMGAYRASTLLDYERGLPLELERLFLRPLHAARQAGVRAPLLANLCRVLTELEARRQAG